MSELLSTPSSHSNLQIIATTGTQSRGASPLAPMRRSKRGVPLPMWHKQPERVNSSCEPLQHQRRAQQDGIHSQHSSVASVVPWCQQEAWCIRGRSPSDRSRTIEGGPSDIAPAGMASAGTHSQQRRRSCTRSVGDSRAYEMIIRSTESCVAECGAENDPLPRVPMRSRSRSAGRRVDPAMLHAAVAAAPRSREQWIAPLDGVSSRNSCTPGNARTSLTHGCGHGDSQAPHGSSAAAPLGKQVALSPIRILFSSSHQQTPVEPIKLSAGGVPAPVPVRCK